VDSTLIGFLVDAVLNAVKKTVIAARTNSSQVTVRILGRRNTARTNANSIQVTTGYWPTVTTLIVVPV
jgi:hypothetical protein